MIHQISSLATVVAFFLCTSCDDSSTSAIVKKTSKSSNVEAEVVELIKNSFAEDSTEQGVNHSIVEEKDNIVEFNQSFTEFSSINGCLGQFEDLDLSNSSGAMISAYSLDVSNYSVYLRTSEFEEWIEMKLNDHVENPNRKVWSPVQLNESVKQIQFKSSKPLDSEVVFRVFKFAKN